MARSPIDTSMVPDERMQRRLRGLEEANYLTKVPKSGLTGWTAPTLVNSFANYELTFRKAGYRKNSDGLVTLRGLVKNAASSTAFVTNMFTLPEGYRPSEQEVFNVRAAIGAAAETAWRIDVTPLGQVVVSWTGTTAFAALSPISFYAD